MIYCIPTDTCYGLACPLSDDRGYGEIYRMKWRDFQKPLAFLIRDISSVYEYASLTPAQCDFLENYPHPFTLLIEPKVSFRFPKFLGSVQYSKIGLRIAEKCIPWEMRDELAYPLFLTSANRSGEREYVTLNECREVFSYDLEYFDGGLCDQKPSDIFSFVATSTQIVYVRRNYGFEKPCPVSPNPLFAKKEKSI